MTTKEDLENNLNRIHEWIRAADQKVSIFLAFQGVVLTLLMPSALTWVTQNARCLSSLNILWVILTTFFFIYGIFKSAMALIPRLNKGTKRPSPIYFGDIATLSLQDFRRMLKETTSDQYLDELIDQVHVSAKIATTKHTQFRDSMIVFAIGISLLIGGTVLVALKSYGQ